MKRIVYAGWLAAGSALFFFPTTLRAQTGDDGVSVTVAEVLADELAPTIPAAGTVHGRSASDITAGLQGRLRHVAEPGDFIEAGQPAATFDCDMLELRREEQLALTDRERIRHESLGREVDRLRRAEHAVPANQLTRLVSDRDLAGAEIRISQVRVRQIDKELERCTALAPFSGVVTTQYRHGGEDVERGEALVAMIDTRNLEVRASVPIRYLPRVGTGGRARIRLDELELDGIVRTAVPAANSASQTFEVRVDLPPEAPGLVAPGQLVSLMLPLTPRAALTVPRDSIVLRDDGTYVMRIDADSRARRVPVVVADASGERVSVSGDLDPGDRIAVRGAESLDDGEAVIVFSDT